jgi:flavin reductase (DIM6/NTAB) family NADH-FMN oxidoreductase RutF
MLAISEQGFFSPTAKEAYMKKSLGAQTLAFPNPVWCVGSDDTQDRPNLMTVAWGGICCSKPPAVTISLRKATYTYGNLMACRAYTVNVPSINHVTEADYVGIASGKKTDKFKTTGLTPVKSDLVHAPYVAEFPMVLECKVIHTFEIGLHTQFIGEIVDVKVEQDALDDAGQPDMGKIAPIVYGSQVQTYHRVAEEIGKAFNIGKTLL